jgi:hypothetical protein
VRGELTARYDIFENVRWEVFLKQFVALLFAFGSAVALAQTPASAPPSAIGAASRATSLVSSFFNGDYFDATGFFDGVFDTTQQAVNAPNTGGAGFDVGGAISSSKTFRDSALSLSYRGEYRDYGPSFGGTGTNQSLNFAYTKRMGLRWTLLFHTNAGITSYGTTNYSFNGDTALNNPFSLSTRYLASGVTLAYRQTQRLTYTISGDFFLNRYTYPGATGATGGIFSGSARYMLTPRTSLAATYSHDQIWYQLGAGTSQIDGAFISGTHRFGRDWDVELSGGASHVHTEGLFRQPAQLVVDGQTITVIELIPYNTTKVVPTVRGAITKRIGQYTLRGAASRGVNPGNGTYLTSSSTMISGYVSRNFGRLSTLTVAGGYTTLESIAKTITQGYSQDTFTVHYSRVLFPHISTNVNYSYYRYGSLLGFSGRSDNRFTFGVAFSTKSVPMTLF